MSNLVYFDFAAAQPLSGGMHGGGEYARSVLSTLIENGHADRLILLVDETRPTPDYFDGLVRERDLQCVNFSSRETLQSILNSGQATRFFSALPYEHGSLDLKGLDVIFTIHGLRPVELPTDRYEYMYSTGLTGLSKAIIKQLFSGLYKRRHLGSFQSLVSANARSTTIIVPSEHTRAALASFLDVPGDVAVQTLYSPQTAVIDDTAEDNGVIREYGLSDRNYLLIVSGSRWIKNSYRALRAIQSLLDTFEPIRKFDIVVTGGLPKRAAGIGGDNLKVLPYVDHRQLRALYAHAFALLYPTLNEGFGYPPIEAMACGTPVLCSDVCSLPEIAGDAPSYFSPVDPGAMAQRVRELIEDPELWSRLRARGLERYQQVSSRQRDDLRRLSELIVGD